MHEAPYEFIDRMSLANEFRLMGHRLAETDVEAVIDLARGRPGRRRDLSGGLKAIREKEYVRVSRPARRLLARLPPRADGFFDAEGGAMTAVSTLTDYVQAYEPDIERVLISSEEIQGKLAEMGQPDL